MVEEPDHYLSSLLCQGWPTPCSQCQDSWQSLGRRAEALKASGGWLRSTGQDRGHTGTRRHNTEWGQRVHRAAAEQCHSLGGHGEGMPVHGAHAQSKHSASMSKRASSTGRTPPAQTPLAQPLCGQRGVQRGSRTGAGAPAPSLTSPAWGAPGRDRKEYMSSSPATTSCTGTGHATCRAGALLQKPAASRTPSQWFWPFWNPKCLLPPPAATLPHKTTAQGRGRREEGRGDTAATNCCPSSHQDSSSGGNRPALTSRLSCSTMSFLSKEARTEGGTTLAAKPMLSTWDGEGHPWPPSWC